MSIYLVDNICKQQIKIPETNGLKSKINGLKSEINVMKDDLNQKLDSILELIQNK